MDESIVQGPEGGYDPDNDPNLGEDTKNFESNIGHTTTMIVEGVANAAGTLYHVRCMSCGPVGVPQEYQVDAEAIAERHAAVGFRRP